MTEEISQKTARWNFKVTEDTDKALRELSAKAGKTMTKTLEDLIEGRRLFSREAEDYINAERERTGKERWVIIEEAILAASKKPPVSTVLARKAKSK